ncbi:hypothetical protein C723_3628 [Christiangramia flava JLT2011]|uniref:Uncharacterized protein n=2 Tax=Christiangramia TaxID=292691 RepID=A0A1L7I7I0_9FLAO|nr:hypothetical protein GRFL_2833 [Christiangramia flava JLT2011]OSS37460.1 hypothetical protein C723_3628 [Christiangramia flava JLT2011]
MLIQIVEENKLLDQNAIETLKLLKTQRNYLIHNIYGLFSDLKEQTILEKKDLIDTDVESFIDKVWLLNENLINVSKIIQES